MVALCFLSRCGAFVYIYIYVQVSDTSIGSADFFLHNVFHHPAFVTGKRASLNNLDLVTDLATDLIVSLYMLASVNHFAVQRVTEFARNFHHYGLGHFVAGDDTSHTTTIVHASPSVFASAVVCSLACSRKIVCMRAISRRKMRKR